MLRRLDMYGLYIIVYHSERVGLLGIAEHSKHIMRVNIMWMITVTYTTILFVRHKMGNYNVVPGYERSYRAQDLLLGLSLEAPFLPF
jgi:hypothetical protein